MVDLDSPLDVIIVGAGPAGFSAGIYALRRGLRVLMIEAKFPGGRIIEAPNVENYPGFPEGIRGEELAGRMLAQYKRFNGGIVSGEEVVGLDLGSQIKVITTRKGRYTSRAVIVAIGVQRRKMSIPGEKEFFGRGVSYCAICDGPIFKGQEVAVVGDEDEAVQDALFLAEIASRVFVIPNKSELSASEVVLRRLEERKNVTVFRGHRAEAVEGEKLVNGLRVKSLVEGTSKTLPVKGVFVAVGTIPASQLIEKAGVEVDERGWIKVNRKQQSNVKGVYAAGDCTGGGMQVSTAVGEGAMAGIWVLREG